MATLTSVSELFENICTVFMPDKAQGDKATFQFNLSGDNGGTYWVKVENGACEAGAGAAPGAADITLLATGDDWLGIANGTLNPMTAFMQGKVKVQGNMGLAMKLQSWFKLG